MSEQNVLDILKKVRHIQIVANRTVNDLLAGQYKSVFRGRGMEFDEVREYQPGDDIRTIDWNVTARTGTPFVKRFCEERELTVLLLVDISASGVFGSVSQAKLDLAVEVAALLMFSALKNNDKVGLLTFADRVCDYFPPRKGKANALRLIRQLVAAEPVAAETNLAVALDYLNCVQKRRAVVFLLSDFLAPAARHAMAIANRHHDLVAVTVSDPRESALPDVGFIRLRDAETGEVVELDTHHPEVRRMFQSRAAERNAELSNRLTKAGVDQLAVRTDEDYQKSLRRSSDARKAVPMKFNATGPLSLWERVRVRAGITAALVLVSLASSGCGTKPAATQDDAAEKHARSQVERGPVRVAVEVQPVRPRLSDLPTLTLTIDYEEGVTVEKPQFGASLGKFIIRDMCEPLPKTRDGRVILQQVLTLEPTETGRARIDPIDVSFTDRRPQGDNTEHTIETEPLSIEVTSLLGDKSPALSDLRPPAAPIALPSGVPAWLWPVLAVVVIAVTAAVWRRRRGRCEKAAAAKGLTPEELANLELDKLVASGLAADDVKHFYVELTGIVRRYIERTTGIRARSRPRRKSREISRMGSHAFLGEG